MSDDGSQNTEAASPAPRRPFRAGLLIAAGIASGVAVGTLVIGPTFAPPTTAAELDADSTATAKGGDAHHGESSEGTPEHGPHLLENLVLNPAGTRGTRFLLFSVGIQMADATTEEALKMRDAETRDRVIRVLGGKTLEQLVDVAARDGYRLEIAAALDSVFGPGSVRAVYFPQFVVQ